MNCNDFGMAHRDTAHGDAILAAIPLNFAERFRFYTAVLAVAATSDLMPLQLAVGFVTSVTILRLYVAILFECFAEKVISSPI